jgi:hypothetical protein
MEQRGTEAGVTGYTVESGPAERPARVSSSLAIASRIGIVLVLGTSVPCADDLVFEALAWFVALL